MTENLAGRGEGLAGLAKSLLNECKGVLSLAEAEIVEAVGHTNLSCLKRRMKELETALEALAAAPAGTAPLTQERAGMIAASLFRDCTAGWTRKREAIIEEIASTLLTVDAAARAALATPSPQAPEVEAIDDRAKVGRALNALDHLCDMWAEEVDLERIVKAISGNPDKVRALLRQSWIEGAYRGRTSHVDYPQPVSPAATQEQPAGSGADSLNEAAQEILKPHWPSVRNMEENEARQKEVERIIRILRGSPRKVGEDGQ